MDTATLYDFASQTLSISSDGWTTDTQLDDIDGWTSLGYMKLITAIEDKLDIELSMDSIMETRSLGDLHAAVQEALS